ncbi:hypothetical protein TNCV_2227131 [Trichonephila clavipes]|uniref:Uncharacterized protein n=1 Tax=Trichonephila clavipes TaxID=2585209 RepID=A0A8X6WEL8_TRICX|nr:hypothetical protein TNCV_2227131 [Trichonephila clavipes]
MNRRLRETDSLMRTTIKQKRMMGAPGNEQPILRRVGQFNGLPDNRIDRNLLLGSHKEFDAQDTGSFS